MAKIESPFFGDVAEIKRFVKKRRPGGDWEDQPNGVWLCRWPDGAVLGWSSTKGTIWSQGPEDIAIELEQSMRAALAGRAGRRAAQRRRLKVRKPVIQM